MNDIPATMRGTGIGAPVRRVEDKRFLRGQGRYVDDLAGADTAQLVMLRSPHASARITRLDVSKARSMPGFDEGVINEAQAGFICFGNTEAGLWCNLPAKCIEQRLHLAHLARVAGGEYQFRAQAHPASAAS